MRLLVLSVLIAFISSASAGKVVDIWHNHFPFIIRHFPFIIRHLKKKELYRSGWKRRWIDIKRLKWLFLKVDPSAPKVCPYFSPRIDERKFLHLFRVVAWKGIMQNIQNAIGNRHVSFKIPAIPFMSNLWRSRNSTGNAAIAKNATTPSNAEGQQQEIGVSSIISTSTAVPTKPGGHPGK